MTTSIALAWHITKKDLRGSYDLIVIWGLLTVAQTLLRTAWPPLTMSLDSDLIAWVSTLKSALPLMRGATLALIVARLVHADPLVGTDAFWMTRPISRVTLFASKLGTMLLVLTLPSTLAQAVTMIAYGVPLLDLTLLLSENLLYFAAGLMMAFVAAVLTPNLRSMAAWTAPFILWAGAAFLTASSTADRSTARQLVVLVLMTMGFGAVVWHQYRTRRRERSALIAAVTLAAAFFLPYLIPPKAIEARAAMTDDPAVALGAGMRFQDGPNSVVMWPLDDLDGQCGVMVRVTQLQGLQSAIAYPQPAYRFTHRPTGTNLISMYFALPDRNLQLGPGAKHYDAEEWELFQVFHRYVVVGPVIESNGPRDAVVKSLSCRDVDVVVRH